MLLFLAIVLGQKRVKGYGTVHHAAEASVQCTSYPIEIHPPVFFVAHNLMLCQRLMLLPGLHPQGRLMHLWVYYARQPFFAMLSAPSIHLRLD